MTSKEALENVKTAPSFMGGNPRYWTCLQSSIPFLEDINTIKQDLDKLDQYKQLKEELGIDFITFFKAIKNGIYCIVEDENNNKVIEKFRVTQLCYNTGTKLFYWYGSIIGYPDLIDYGKTWALTKEELQDDK